MKRFLSRLRLEHLVLVGGVVALFAGVLVFAQRTRGLGYDPRNAKQGSSHYTTPAGGKALYELLWSLRIPAFRHSRAIELLSAETQALFVLAPAVPLKAEESAWAARWVSDGGTLVWCPRRGTAAGGPDPLLSAFGVRLARGPGPEAVECGASLRPVQGGIERTYALSVSGALRLDAESGDRDFTRLAEDAHGGVAAMVRHGRGRFIALADPEIVSNAGLARAGNAEFMVHLAKTVAGGRPVAFDEFHHGFAEGQSAFAVVMDSSVGPAVVLAVLAGLCGVFAGGRRLGPPVELHEERRRKPAEFMDALAGLCRKMRAAPQALSMILSEFRLDLQRRHLASTPEAVERIAARAGLERGAATRAVERARRAATADSLDEGAFLSSCRELESVRRALRRGEIGRKTR